VLKTERLVCVAQKVESKQIKNCPIYIFCFRCIPFKCQCFLSILLFLLCVSLLLLSCSSIQGHLNISTINSDTFCCVCRSSSNDKINCLLECCQCLIRVCLFLQLSNIELLNGSYFLYETRF